MYPAPHDVLISHQDTSKLKSKTYLDHLEIRIGYKMTDRFLPKETQAYRGEWAAYFHTPKIFVKNGIITVGRNNLSTNGVRLLKAHRKQEHQTYNKNQRKKHQDHNLLPDDLRRYLDEQEIKSNLKPWQFQLQLAENAIWGIDKYIRSQFRVAGCLDLSCKIELYKEYPFALDSEKAHASVEAAITHIFGLPERIHEKRDADLKETRHAKWRSNIPTYKNLAAEIKFYPKSFSSSVNNHSGYFRLELKVKLGEVPDVAHKNDLEAFIRYVKSCAEQIDVHLNQIEERLSFIPSAFDEKALERKIKSICKMPINRINEIIRQLRLYNGHFSPSDAPKDGDHCYTTHVMKKLADPIFGIFTMKSKSKPGPEGTLVRGRGNIYFLKPDWKDIVPAPKQAQSKSKLVPLWLTEDQRLVLAQLLSQLAVDNSKE